MSLLASPTAIGDEVSAASAPGALADLRMNQLQVRGTHNSYHLYPRFFGIPFLPFAVHRSHRYEHPPLVEQLRGHPPGVPCCTQTQQLEQYAVRQLELDVHMRRWGNRFFVHHLPWVDNQSSCKRLETCLEEILAWSDARAGRHAPLLIWIEPKDQTFFDRWATLGFYEQVNFADIEAAILSVVPAERIPRPDDVRRPSLSLSKSVQRGWPRLADVQGQFAFCLLVEGERRDRYVGPDGNLAGRLMFVRASDPEANYAAFFKINNALPTYEALQELAALALNNPKLKRLQMYPHTVRAHADEGVKEESDELELAFRYWLTLQHREGAEHDPSHEPDKEFAKWLQRTHPDSTPYDQARQRAAYAELEKQLLAAKPEETDPVFTMYQNLRESPRFREELFLLLDEQLETRQKAEILRLVQRGFIVTTTADDITRSPGYNERRSKSALASGAQFISTDRLRRADDGYAFDFQGPPIVCNQINKPASCRNETLGEL